MSWYCSARGLPPPSKQDWAFYLVSWCGAVVTPLIELSAAAAQHAVKASHCTNNHSSLGMHHCCICQSRAVSAHDVHRSCIPLFPHALLLGAIPVPAAGYPGRRSGTRKDGQRLFCTCSSGRLGRGAACPCGSGTGHHSPLHHLSSPLRFSRCGTCTCIFIFCSLQCVRQQQLRFLCSRQCKCWRVLCRRPQPQGPAAVHRPADLHGAVRVPVRISV